MNHRRIDVHHHVLPPSYVSWLKKEGIGYSGGRALPDWSVSSTQDLMGKYGIETAILSLSTPGVCLRLVEGKNDEGRRWAREVNEFSAQLSQEQPGRFGFFATLVLPDLDGAIDEAAYALDTLHASGVILLANNHGKYLGDESDHPLFAELDRRRAVIFIHPSELPGPGIPGIPAFAADFLLDTTRAAYRLVRNGFLKRYPNLKIILSHAGGFVPYASHRMAAAVSQDARRPVDEVLEDFRSFYFDTALSGSPAALPSLLAFAKPGHVLFGSDWPFAPEEAVAYFTGHLDAYRALDESGRKAIDRDSALGLFPKFSA
jgi:predicted TIM-barrel fold metal-dependent hydrolase